MRRLLPLLALSVLLFCGCVPSRDWVPTCTVVFEDNDSLFFYRQVYQLPQGEDLSVTVGVPTGYRIDSVSYDRCTVSGKTAFSASYDYYTLLLQEVRYSVLIRLTAVPARVSLFCPGEGEPISLAEDGTHLRLNTPAFHSSFNREGFVPIGWNTAPDGSGTSAGFGSRVEPGQTHYLRELPSTPAERFSYVLTPEGAVVTGFSGQADPLVIPGELGGAPVVSIAAGAFGTVQAETLVLPPSLKAVEDGAFEALEAEHLYLFDTLETVSEQSFGSYAITHLHINAARPPVYSGSYFDTLSDKVDYLQSLSGQRKIALLGGSSLRFGCDSPMLEGAFPGYKVVNMGVYAYSNMLPQAKILLSFLGPGDVLISSPELDAIDTQFCGKTNLDREAFCMLESNYDLLSMLDCREFTDIFSAFGDYQAARSKLPDRSYSLSPSNFDEDGVRQESAVYNRWGDYILYRENNLSRKLFGVKRAFYNASHISEGDWMGLNRIYDEFSAKGVRVFFLYSPRSRDSISSDSTSQSIRELGELFHARLHAQILSPIEDSLMDPLYFYGTDNHLSTQGVTLRTRQIIDALRPWLEDLP